MIINYNYLYYNIIINIMHINNINIIYIIKIIKNIYILDNILLSVLLISLRFVIL